MTTIEDIIKTTYILTFDHEADYDWLNIAEVFIDSEDIASDVAKQKLINNAESEEKLMYWRDLFFMEIAEHEKALETNNLFEKITAHPLFIENKKFIDQLPKATTKLGRELLIDTLIDNEKADILVPDDILEVALKKKSRDDLRKDFKDWDKESKEIEKPNENKGNVISLSWIKYTVAAAVILSFLIWQPTQSTDNELFAYYKSNLDSLTQNNFGLLETEISKSNERGDEYILNNYSKAESEKALSGLNSFKEGNFDKAKKILIELNPKEHSKQILFFLALTQLNTNELDTSILNLEYLLNQSKFSFSDDVKFHLAMAYLKQGERNKSQHLFKELIANNSRFKDDAKLILKEMRWF